MIRSEFAAERGFLFGRISRGRLSFSRPNLRAPANVRAYRSSSSLLAWAGRLVVPKSAPIDIDFLIVDRRMLLALKELRYMARAARRRSV